MGGEYRSNLRKHWRGHVAHVGIALSAMLLAGLMEPAFVMVVAAQLVRQCVGYWEKRDTVSIDLAYIVGGAFVGMMLAAAALLAGPNAP